jgi:hypothetical protein
MFRRTMGVVTANIRSGGVALLLAAAAALAACTGAPSTTGIVVEVTSDLRVPSQMDGVRLLVTGSTGASLYDQSFPLVAGAGAVASALPLRVAFQPQGADIDQFRIEVRGLLGTATVVSRSATLGFEQGRVVLLSLPLLALCLPEICTETGTTCDETGTCQPDGVDTTMLPTYHPAPDGGDVGAVRGVLDGSAALGG